MLTDHVYNTKYNNVFLLFEASGREWDKIPQEYLGYFYHEFENGNVSLLPAISKLEKTEFLEDWHLEEVVEYLSNVNPFCWPDLKFIEAIDANQILSESSVNSEKFLEYVEDNLGTSEKVQKVLKNVIQSVFGGSVDNIRSLKKEFPSPKNNFLQEEDGTFAGTFTHEDHEFHFEIAPTEQGWLCTYRMTEKCLGKLEKPQFKGSDGKHFSKNKKIRSQSWR